jgi:hypothetical protein
MSGNLELVLLDIPVVDANHYLHSRLMILLATIMHKRLFKQRSFSASLLVPKIKFPPLLNYIFFQAQISSSCFVFGSNFLLVLFRITSTVDGEAPREGNKVGILTTYWAGKNEHGITS